MKIHTNNMGVKSQDQTVLVIVCYLVIFLVHVFTFPYSLNIVFELLLGAVLYTRVRSLCYIKNALTIAIAIGVAGAISSLFTTSFKLEGYLLSIAFYLPLSIVIRESYINPKTILYLLIVLFIVIVVNEGFITGRTALLKDSSRNFYSAFFMVVVFAIFCEYDTTSKHHNSEIYYLVAAVITFAVSVISVGRGGIVASSVLLLGVILLMLFSEDSKRINVLTKITIFSAVLAVTVYLILNQEAIGVLFSRFYIRKGIGISSEPRAIMIDQYIAAISGIKEVLFGVDFANCTLINQYGGNPHNSFILAHSSYGAVYILLVITAFITILRRKTCVSEKKYIIIYLLAFYIRAFMDSIFANGYGDIVIYYSLITLFDKGRRHEYY